MREFHLVHVVGSIHVEFARERHAARNRQRGSVALVVDDHVTHRALAGCHGHLPFYAGLRQDRILPFLYKHNIFWKFYFKIDKYNVTATTGVSFDAFVQIPGTAYSTCLVVTPDDKTMKVVTDEFNFNQVYHRIQLNPMQKCTHHNHSNVNG